MKISVVIPAFNREATIERALQSVYSQTILPHEVIVVDDCSTDNTVCVVRRLQKQKNNLKLFILEKNCGSQKARNFGIRNATGEWIAFLDSDDEWLPKKTEIQVKALEDNPSCSAVFSDAYYRKDGVDVYHKCGDRNKRIYHTNDFLFGIEALFQSIIVRKRVLEDIGYLDPLVPAYQEWDARICISKCTPFLYVPRPSFIYHFDQESGFRTSQKRIEGFKYIVMKHKELYMSMPGGDYFFCDGMYRLYKSVHSFRQYFYRARLVVIGFSNGNPYGKKEIVRLNDQQVKMKEFYDLLNRWLSIKQSGGGLHTYFNNHGYSTIAVYGMKELGQRLVDELKDTEITVKYGIDQNPGINDNRIRICKPNDELEKVDVIVVTAIHYFEQIAISLRDNTDCPIVSLENVVYEL